MDGVTDKLDPKLVTEVQRVFEALERVLEGKDSELSDDERAEAMEKAFLPRPPFPEGAVVIKKGRPDFELVVLSSSLDMAQVYDGSGKDPAHRITWQWTEVLEGVSGPTDETVCIARSARNMVHSAFG